MAYTRLMSLAIVLTSVAMVATPSNGGAQGAKADAAGRSTPS